MSDNFANESPVLTASFSLARRLTAAQIAALGAIQTATLDFGLLPAKTIVKSVLLVVSDAIVGVTTLLFSLGYDAGGPYQDYLNQHDLVGDGAGDIVGVSPSIAAETIPCAAIPSATTATALKGVLTCSTGAETFAAVSAGDISIYFECGVLPS